jgi:hypothetical protein
MPSLTGVAGASVVVVPSGVAASVSVALIVLLMKKPRLSAPGHIGGAVEPCPARAAPHLLLDGRRLRLRHLFHAGVVLLACARGASKPMIVMSAPWRSIACAWSREWLTWPRAISWSWLSIVRR